MLSYTRISVPQRAFFLALCEQFSPNESFTAAQVAQKIHGSQDGRAIKDASQMLSNFSRRGHVERRAKKAGGNARFVYWLTTVQEWRPAWVLELAARRASNPSNTEANGVA
jgi:hypothetical protein